MADRLAHCVEKVSDTQQYLMVIWELLLYIDLWPGQAVKIRNAPV